MSKKYEFTGETTKLVDGTVVNRIRRLSDGLVGGWIQSEANLSHKGDCFVYDDACVSGNALVYEHAKIQCMAGVYGNAQIYGNAVITGVSSVYGNAFVFENAVVTDSTWVRGDAQVGGSLQVVGMNGIQGYNVIQWNEELLEYEDSEITIPTEYKTCPHDWVTTMGFTSTYIDCRLCSKKKEDL